jgi:hypothetical protein
MDREKYRQISEQFFLFCEYAILEERARAWMKQFKNGLQFWNSNISFKIIPHFQTKSLKSIIELYYMH